MCFEKQHDMPYTLLVTTVKKTGNWDRHIVTQYSHCTKAFTSELPYGSTVHRTQNTRRAQPSQLPYGSTVHRTQPTRRAQPSQLHTVPRCTEHSPQEEHSLLNAGLHAPLKCSAALCPDHLYQISTKLGNKCEEGGGVQIH